MSDVEESAGPVRKTRSGRAVKTPAKPKSATAKPASRKTRKKVVVMEVEVTDDEEVDQAEESEPVEKKAKLDEDKLLEASDTEETDENNKTEEALLNSGDEADKKSKGPELVMNDIAMLEEIMHTNEKITEKVQEAEESETEEAKKTVDKAEPSCATVPAAREKKENGVSEEEKSEEEVIDNTEEIEEETPEVKEAEEKKPKGKKTEDKNPKVKESEKKTAEKNESEETPTVKKSEEKKSQVKQPEKKTEVKETGEEKPEVKKAEEKTPEVKEAEENKPEVKKAEEKTPEVKEAEENKPKVKKAEEKTPEVKEAEEKTPQVKEAENKPEIKKTEEKTPEVKEAEENKPKVKEPEQKKPELKEPEEEKPEVKQPEDEKPDEKEPHQETPEVKEEKEKKIPEVNEPEEKKPEAKEPEKKKPEVKESKKEKPEVKIKTVEETTPVEAVLNDSDVEMKEIKEEPQTQIKLEVKEEAKEEVKEEIKEEVKEEVKKEVKAQNGEPEAENISDDELPGVPVVKVPETEEVSDEELPGPKRAELPADTEVVSEDELPANTKKDAEEEEAASPSKKESGKRKLSEGDYDPTSPTSENEAPAKKTKEDKEEKDKEGADAAKAKPKKLPELDKYWKAVNDDPTDFTGWTYLLQYVDQENDMEAAREAYDAFLSHYPYCYGYWRKYADYEKKKGNKKKCEEVFERGLKSIPLSVDLWIHYLTYVKTTRGEDEEYVRSQFERAINACGLEFRSDRLWDSYIKWETDGKRVQKVTVLFDRLLTTPTQGYTAHFDNFQEHVSSNNPNKILEVDEFMALRKEVRTLLKNDEKAADNADLPPGDEDSKLYTSDEETKCIRERIVSIRRKIHKTTVTAVTARWNFEEGIKRPYFHVKPLERCQLKNWQEYLDYEIEQGDRTRIIVLFERCLIACALYEEFWLKFVHYLESLKDSELQPKIRDVYERACTIHHLKKPKLHLQWAVFEEMSDNLNRAAEILVNLEKQVPNVLQVAYRRINLERRRSDFEKSSQLFEHYIGNSKNKMISSNIAIKYSRFCLKITKDFDKAQEILKTAITKDPNNPRLYLQLVDLTLQKEDVKEEDVCAVIEEFLEKETADPDQKTLFAQRKLEYLEDFGSSIETVQAAFEQLQKYQKLSKEATKKKEPKGDSSSSSSSKKEKAPPSSTTQSQSYSNYNYGTSSNQPPYNYSGSQQGQYNYPQYGQAPATGDQQQQQYQYQNWQYPQGGAAAYGGYNQWGGYTGGYSGY